MKLHTHFHFANLKLNPNAVFDAAIAEKKRIKLVLTRHAQGSYVELREGREGEGREGTDCSATRRMRTTNSHKSFLACLSPCNTLSTTLQPFFYESFNLQED